LEVREMFLILLCLAVPSTFAQFTLTVKVTSYTFTIV